MTTAFLSDAHVVGGQDPVQRRVVRFLDTVEADELVVLGDLFHHWWGFAQWTQVADIDATVRPTCAALERLVGRGVHVVYVRGNHDFALGPFFTETLAVEVAGWHVRTVHGAQVVVAHGDECDGSLGYAITRRVLRGSLFAAMIESLGPVRAQRLLSRLAGSSRDHGGPPGPLLARQQAWATARAAEGADAVVVGHTHCPQDLRLAGGRYLNLGDFGRDRTWLLWDEEGPRLLVTGEDGDASASQPWTQRP
ncbi:MAG: UDP-2,3-diacylglucosamine diphosphatase [Alphaproteobacteria bacterium]|nr:UDP-2,3-diacylglucosamine diphosphatase [Alphaproteobacteria bacterium]